MYKAFVHVFENNFFIVFLQTINNKYTKITPIWPFLYEIYIKTNYIFLFSYLKLKPTRRGNYRTSIHFILSSQHNKFTSNLVLRFVAMYILLTLHTLILKRQRNKWTLLLLGDTGRTGDCSLFSAFWYL